MKRTAFTLLEAIVVVAVLLILAAILFPVFTRSREPIRRPSCQSPLKHISLGFKQYIQDYDEKYPIAKNSNSGLSKTDNWIGQIMPYMKSEQIFLCPSEVNSKPGRSSYAYNALLSRISEKTIHDPAIIILNFEVIADPNNWTQTGNSPAAVTASTRHFDGSNFSFVDGHVKWFKPGRVTATKPDGSTPTFIPG